VTLDDFSQIWAVDFEFVALPGERPNPVCLVALELRSSRLIRLMRDEFGDTPPYPIGPSAVFLAYYAAAELGCHLALGWQQPAHVLDLFVEFRNRTNGLETPCGTGLLGALTYFGLDGIDAAAKREIQTAIGDGSWVGKYSRDAVLDYCETDVRSLERLLPVMASQIDLPRALLRGRYISTVARMEYAGVPIDRERLELLREHWAGIQAALIAAIDADYGVFEGQTFKSERFASWLAAAGIPWPRLDTNRLDLSDETFRQMARVYPRVSPLRELRSSLADLRLNDLAVGRDNRNRTMLSPFRSRTGRNQPSNSKFVFGPSVWLRGLIKPPPGHGVAYIDWSQQEFGIAAALSGDRLMQAAYMSGDPYLTFAKQAGAVPPDATRKSHAVERELYKTTVLAVQYGMEWQSLAVRLGQPPAMARALLQAHRETYRAFWRWSDAVVDHAVLTGSLPTVFGWTLHTAPDFNSRSLRNYPMQANGAEMLRLAICLATERGVEVCAPVHDAVLICARLDLLDADVARLQSAMAEASRIVLAGFELQSDVSITYYPDRYADQRGVVMWARVMKLVAECEGVGATDLMEHT
jgi:DNA polymerase I